MFFRGSSPSIRRIANYNAKVRAYTGTGTVPDYTPPINWQKLTAKCRSAQRGLGGCNQAGCNRRCRR